MRKELNFCRKTDTRILGMVENMSGFVCPHCNCESQIFPPVSGGVKQVCDQMEIPLLCQVPLEPKLLMACESGKCFLTEHPDSVTADRFTQLVTKIKESASSSDKTK